MSSQLTKALMVDNAMRTVSTEQLLSHAMESLKIEDTARRLAPSPHACLPGTLNREPGTVLASRCFAQQYWCVCHCTLDGCRVKQGIKVRACWHLFPVHTLRDHTAVGGKGGSSAHVLACLGSVLQCVTPGHRAFLLSQVADKVMARLALEREMPAATTNTIVVFPTLPGA